MTTGLVSLSTFPVPLHLPSKDPIFQLPLGQGDERGHRDQQVPQQHLHLTLCRSPRRTNKTREEEFYQTHQFSWAFHSKNF